jgi:hypothetical protein
MKSLMRLEPFRFMRKMDPFEELRAMQYDMERIFDQFLGRDISSAESHGHARTRGAGLQENNRLTRNKAYVKLLALSCGEC